MYTTLVYVFMLMTTTMPGHMDGAKADEVIYRDGIGLSQYKNASDCERDAKASNEAQTHFNDPYGEQLWYGGAMLCLPNNGQIARKNLLPMLTPKDFPSNEAAMGAHVLVNEWTRYEYDSYTKRSGQLLEIKYNTIVIMRDETSCNNTLRKWSRNAPDNIISGDYLVRSQLRCQPIAKAAKNKNMTMLRELTVIPYGGQSRVLQ